MSAKVLIALARLYKAAGNVDDREAPGVHALGGSSVQVQMLVFHVVQHSTELRAVDVA